jgi:hypothetical protein
MANEHNPVAEVGNLMASLLASPHCPSTVREAINAHLNNVYERADLTKPDIVRMLYHLLASQEAPQAVAPATAVADKSSGTPVEETVLAEIGTIETAGLNGKSPDAISEGEVLEAVAS